MGKSTAAFILSRFGVPIVDTDTLARDLTQPGSASLTEIRDQFGEQYIGGDGALNRQALAERIFQRPEDRLRLEAILHPRIQAAWKAALESWRREGQTVGAVVIPLLFEKRYETEFDVVVAIACSAASQRERLRQRGWSEAHATERLRSQMPVAQKMDRARFVVWTEGDLSVHEAQWKRVLENLRS